MLVHGSTGASISMHKAAQALQAAGATVYSISLRGHGGSGTVNGDSSYKNQLDDDLVDFVKAVGLDDPKMHRTLVGFSLGGGLVLRTASGPHRDAFDAYLAVSPQLGQDSPTARPATGGWVSVAVPRMIGLSLLDAFGLPWFQNLPVVRFATDAAPSDSRTPVYSYRLVVGEQLPRLWRPAIARIARPTAVVVGERDELFVAAAFAPLFAELNPKIAVSVEPGLGHLDMIGDPRGTAAIAVGVAEARRLRRSAARRTVRHEGARGHVRGLRRRRGRLQARHGTDRPHACRQSEPRPGADLARLGPAVPGRPGVPARRDRRGHEAAERRPGRSRPRRGAGGLDRHARRARAGADELRHLRRGRTTKPSPTS